MLLQLAETDLLAGCEHNVTIVYAVCCALGMPPKVRKLLHRILTFYVQVLVVFTRWYIKNKKQTWYICRWRWRITVHWYSFTIIRSKIHHTSCVLHHCTEALSTMQHMHSLVDALNALELVRDVMLDGQIAG
jgi:hypothetical protein